MEEEAKDLNFHEMGLDDRIMKVNAIFLNFRIIAQLTWFERC